MQRQIDLLLPGLFWDTALKQLNEQDYRPKNLERALSRAEFTTQPGVDLTTTLFNLFGVRQSAGCDLPSGAVTAYASELHAEGDCWALATPVHLLADRDRLILIRLAPETIEEDYAKRLIGRFNAHFEAEGMSLLEAAGGQWCLKLSALPEVITSDIESVAGRHIESYMPSGRDGAYWRGLLNEIQMLIYQEQNSQLTGSRGEPDINGIWLSGFGVCPEVTTSYNAMFGTDALLSGLAGLSNLPLKELPEDIAEVTEAKGNIGILLTALHEAELNVDESGWKSAVDFVEQQLSRLLDAVDTNRETLSILTCKGHRFAVRRRWSILGPFRRVKSLYRIMGELSSERK